MVGLFFLNILLHEFNNIDFDIFCPARKLANLIEVKQGVEMLFLLHNNYFKVSER